MKQWIKIGQWDMMMGQGKSGLIGHFQLLVKTSLEKSPEIYTRIIP